MRYHAHKIEVDPEAGLSDAALAEVEDTQDKVDQVMVYYLAEIRAIKAWESD